MKKNITINLRGRLYQIDEDAYELLQNYISTLRNYFRRTEGGDEIVDDIEARVAELFDELRGNGVEAVTIEHVQSIISRIGNPEDMEGGASPDPSQGGETEAEEVTDKDFEDSSEAKGNTFADNLKGMFNGKKRLFRDPSDKKVSGLLAGLACHFGGDATWWRVGYVLLTVAAFSIRMDSYRYDLHFGWWFVVAYIVLSFLVPMAQSPEDRLRMKGKDVNPQNLADELNAEATAAANPKPQQSGAEGCMNGCLNVFGVLLKILLILGAVALALPLLCFIVFCLALLFSPISLAEESGWFNDMFLQIYQGHPMPIWMFAICIVAAAGIPLYCAVHMFLTWFDKVKPMGMGQRFAWLFVWLIAIAGIIASALWIEKYHEEIRKEQWRPNYEERHEYEDPIDTPTDTLQLDSLSSRPLPIPPQGEGVE